MLKGWEYSVYLAHRRSWVQALIQKKGKGKREEKEMEKERRKAERRRGRKR